MNVSAPFIARPVATTLLTIGIAIAGMLAFRLLPVAPLPQVDFPTISVRASLPGASPDTMAATVATPLERALGSIAGVTEITSSSSLGSTRVTLQFDLSRDIDGAARDVQAGINAARSMLPTGMPSNPSYRKVNPADAPIMILALTSDVLTQGQMYDVASTVLAQKFSQVKGVGEVTIGGSALPAVRLAVHFIPVRAREHQAPKLQIHAAAYLNLQAGAQLVLQPWLVKPSALNFAGAVANHRPHHMQLAALHLAPAYLAHGANNCGLVAILNAVDGFERRVIQIAVRKVVQCVAEARQAQLGQYLRKFWTDAGDYGQRRVEVHVGVWFGGHCGGCRHRALHGRTVALGWRSTLLFVCALVLRLFCALLCCWAQLRSCRWFGNRHTRCQQFQLRKHLGDSLWPAPLRQAGVVG